MTPPHFLLLDSLTIQRNYFVCFSRISYLSSLFLLFNVSRNKEMSVETLSMSTNPSPKWSCLDKTDDIRHRDIYGGRMKNSLDLAMFRTQDEIILL